MRRQAAVHVSLDLASSAALLALRKFLLPLNYTILGVPMIRHMIWAEDEKFTGWCCSQCLWGIVAPRLESTVAALAFNREAQKSFDGHACVRHIQRQETMT